MLSEQDLIAWIEATASPEERAQMDAELQRDPDLRRSLLAQIQMDNVLRVSLGDAQLHERVKQSILTVMAGDEAALKQQVLADTTFFARPKNENPLYSSARALFDSLRPAAWAFGLATACVCIVLAWFSFRPSPQTTLLAMALEMPVRVEFPRGTIIFSETRNQPNANSGTFVPRSGNGLRVGNNGSGTITFADGTVLHLEPATEVRFQSIANSSRHGGKQLKLISGSLSAIVAKQPKDLPLLIETPHALITVVGTEFDLEVATNQTELEVTHGLVEMSGSSAREKLQVGAGEMAVVSQDAKPQRLPRNPYFWPFSSASPWNTPIGDGAKYEPVPGHPFLADGPLIDAVQHRRPFLGRPADPVRNVWVNDQIRGDLRLSENALPKNNLREPIVFLQRTRRYAFELRDVSVRPDGDLNAADSERTDLTGPGVNANAVAAIPFGLSNLGGLIRMGEYEHGIRHALSARVKRERLGGRASFQRPSTVWPATGGAETSGEFLNVGTLLAIPPDVDIRQVVGDSGPAYELARAMQDYGIYITGFIDAPFVLLAAEARLERNEEDAMLNNLVPLLRVVENNTPQAPGGGGAPRRELAPALPTR